MSRRYKPEEKQNALQQLAANGGDIALTSAQLNIPQRTLSRWKKQHSGEIRQNDSPQPPPPQPQKPPPISDDDAENLRNLQHRIFHKTLKLIDEINGAAADDPSLNQIVGAISQLIDRYMKLAAQLPRKEREPFLRIEYVEVEEDEDNHQAPPLSTQDLPE